MKKWFGCKAVVRQFHRGDQVLVLLPSPGSALTARFLSPYAVEMKVSDTDYVIFTPECRRKTWLCHVNMVKPYLTRDTSRVKQKSLEMSASLVCAYVADDGLNTPSCGQQSGRLANSEFLSDVDSYLSYLPDEQWCDILHLLHLFPLCLVMCHFILISYSTTLMWVVLLPSNSMPTAVLLKNIRSGEKRVSYA